MKKKIKSGIVNIHVMFSDHCFTSSISDLKNSSNLNVYGFSSKDRVFDIERYNLSLNLKSIIKEMKMKDVFFSKKDDLFYFCINEKKKLFYIF